MLDKLQLARGRLAFPFFIRSVTCRIITKLFRNKMGWPRPWVETITDQLAEQPKGWSIHVRTNRLFQWLASNCPINKSALFKFLSFNTKDYLIVPELIWIDISGDQYKTATPPKTLHDIKFRPFRANRTSSMRIELLFRLSLSFSSFDPSTSPHLFSQLSFLFLDWGQAIPVLAFATRFNLSTSVTLCVPTTHLR